MIEAFKYTFVVALALPLGVAAGVWILSEVFDVDIREWWKYRS